MTKIDRKMQFCDNQTRRAELTGKQLQEVTDSGRLYRHVGKMFMITNKQEITMSLKADIGIKTVEKK